VSRDKSPLDHVLDLALFAPLGLALTAKDAIPEWVDTGRRRILHQVEVARLVGEHATRHGEKMVAGTLVGLGILPGPPPPSPSAAPSPPPSPPPAGAGEVAMAPNAVAPPTDPSPVPPVPPVVPGANGRGPDVARPRRTDPSPPRPAAANRVPASDGLAIPGYDSLSASQVVQRLAGLAPAELEAVRLYEAGSRGRRTILTKISQLETGRP
jgi:hypothetical protein